MTPAILEAMNDGVSLALSSTGNIKASGDGTAVNRWLPTIREHKADIVAALQDEQRIRGWFKSIDEDDPEIIDEYLEKCRTDPSALAYFLKRASELWPD